MKFRCTCITSEEVGSVVGSVTVRIEKSLNKLLADADFGSDLYQFTIFVIAVDDDLIENAKWEKPRNSLSSFKDYWTNESRKDLSIAIAISPSDIQELDEAALLRMVGKRSIERLRSRPKRLPKGLDWLRLSAAITAVLNAYVQ